MTSYFCNLETLETTGNGVVCCPVLSNLSVLLGRVVNAFVIEVNFICLFNKMTTARINHRKYKWALDAGLR
jgi:hypothetical protein